MYTLDKMIYEGKAKRIYSVNESGDLVAMVFKNSLTAFNGEKKEEREGKGLLNFAIAHLIFEYLKSKGVESHLVGVVDELTMVCQKVTVVPLEVVVRNKIAGSFAKKFNRLEGEPLIEPLVEFFLKDDSLGDPFISDDQIMVLQLVKDRSVLDQLKTKARKINLLLMELFSAINIDLIDFKLEFGFDLKGQLLLVDEITPDSCRLWDKSTGAKMDKDVFRRDLGDVLEGYREVLNRLKKLEEKI